MGSSTVPGRFVCSGQAEPPTAQWVPSPRATVPERVTTGLPGACLRDPKALCKYS